MLPSTVTQMSENSWTSVVEVAEADETMNAKLKELDRLADVGAHETVDNPVALGEKRVATLWELDHR